MDEHRAAIDVLLDGEFQGLAPAADGISYAPIRRGVAGRPRRGPWGRRPVSVPGDGGYDGLQRRAADPVPGDGGVAVRSSGRSDVDFGFVGTRGHVDSDSDTGGSDVAPPARAPPPPRRRREAPSASSRPRGSRRGRSPSSRANRSRTTSSMRRAQPPQQRVPPLPSSAPESPAAPQTGPDGAPDPAAGEDLDAPVFEYRPVDNPVGADSGGEDELEGDDDPNWCFMCFARDAPDQFGGHPYLRGLETLCQENYGSVSLPALTRMMQNYYETNLRQFIEPASERRPWHRRVIAEHIEEHAPDATTDCTRNLRVVRGALRVLGDRLVMQNTANTRDRRLDNRNTKLYMALLTTMQRLAAQADRMGGRSGRASRD